MVQTDAGPVTLATVDDLRVRASQWRDWAQKSSASAQSLRTRAEDEYAAAGTVLVAHAAGWTPAPELAASLAEAHALTDQARADDLSDASLREHESSAGFLGRISVRRQERHIEHDRAEIETKLRGLLISIARSAPSSSVGEANPHAEAAQQLDAKAAAMESDIESAKQWAAACDAEVARRNQAIEAMGFDSLYDAAVLERSGAPTVDAPLVLKKGERAYLASAATLARMVSRTHYEGRTSGFSFPIGHTGIRYRIGGFRGEPVRQDLVSKIDTGTFVVTNQRIAYIGHTKSVSVPLDKLLHIEVYNDGISVSREGKENPDFYLMSNTKRVVFLLNWALSQRAEGH